MLSRFIRKSVLLKVVLIVVITNTLILGIAGFLEYRSTSDYLRKEFITDSETLVHRLALQFAPIVWAYDSELAEEMLASEMRNHALAGILIFESSKTDPLYRTWRADNGSLTSLPPVIPDELVKVRSPIIRNTTEIGGVQVFLSQDHFHKTTQRALGIIVMKMVLQDLFLIIVLTIMIRRYILHPFQAVHTGMHRIEQGELDYTLPTQTEDEIGQMAQTFNIMVERLNDRATELQESEKKFRNLVESTTDWIWEINAELTFVYSSPQVESILGISSDQLLGKELNEVLLPAKAQSFIDQYKWHLITGNDISQLEVEFQHRDGTLRTVEINGRSVLGDKEQILGLRGVGRDITERKEMEEEKSRLEDQLMQTQKIEAIGRLAGGIAHDLNNLLTPILGYSELMQTAEENDLLSSADQAKEINKAGTKARDLVRQLLAFSRKQTLDCRLVDMNGILKDFESLLRRTLREDIDLQIVHSPSSLPILIDKSQIEQVLLNLSVNAADAMPNGGLLKIETELVEIGGYTPRSHLPLAPGNYATLSFSDTGIGMKEEIKKHIFEPFFSTKGEHGTGLGLATVYGIIKQHNGHVWVYSEPEKGTTFKLYFPMTNKGDVNDSAQPDPAKPQTGNETILVVEDNVHVLQITKEILSQLGYSVLTAEDGQAALELLNEGSDTIKLLLTDVIMPKMNGRELAAQALAIVPDLKVLFTSGYTDDIIAHHGVLDPDVQFIQKPFSTASLAARIREILD